MLSRRLNKFSSVDLLNIISNFVANCFFQYKIKHTCQTNGSRDW